MKYHDLMDDEDKYNKDYWESMIPELAKTDRFYRIQFDLSYSYDEDNREIVFSSSTINMTIIQDWSYTGTSTSPVTMIVLDNEKYGTVDEYNLGIFKIENNVSKYVSKLMDKIHELEEK